MQWLKWKLPIVDWGTIVLGVLKPKLLTYELKPDTYVFLQYLLLQEPLLHLGPTRLLLPMKQLNFSNSCEKIQLSRLSKIKPCSLSSRDYSNVNLFIRLLLHLHL